VRCADKSEVKVLREKRRRLALDYRPHPRYGLIPSSDRLWAPAWCGRGSNGQGLRRENQLMRCRHARAGYVNANPRDVMKSKWGLPAFVLLSLALSAVTRADAPIASAGEVVPCKVHQRVGITFPVRALSEGVLHGEALLMLEVTRTGELGDVLVVAYTRREFADAVLDAVKQWRYAPALVGGEPVGSTITLNVQFEVNGVLAYVRPPGTVESDAGWSGRFAYQPFSVQRLDRVPVAISQAGPIYPREWILQGRTGTVRVDFFIDEDGRVRFPQVVSEADEFLGSAALAAVREWRFESPLHKRRPVLTRASQVFYFEPPALGPTR
jgi:TonB family protein